MRKKRFYIKLDRLEKQIAKILKRAGYEN